MDAVRLSRRLQRLEQHLGDAGCPACCDRRGGIVLVTSRRLQDGTRWRSRSSIEETVVETREDVDRLVAEGLYRPT
jgi:hypothetical protein